MFTPGVSCYSTNKKGAIDMAENSTQRLSIIKGTPYGITDKVLLADLKWLIGQVETLQSLNTKLAHDCADKDAKCEEFATQNRKLNREIGNYSSTLEGIIKVQQELSKSMMTV